MNEVTADTPRQLGLFQPSIPGSSRLPGPKKDSSNNTGQINDPVNILKTIMKPNEHFTHIKHWTQWGNSKGTEISGEGNDKKGAFWLFKAHLG